jgi:hypothetical protein
MGLTSAELSIMRDSIELLLPDTCNVCTITNTPDGEGGSTQSRATAGTSIPCRLDVVQGREQVTGGAVQPYIAYKMSLPYDTTVGLTNIIEHNSVDYYVKSVNLSQSWKAVVRVDLERV